MGTSTSLMVPFEFEVEHQDGTVHAYRTVPLDSWRAEKITGKAIGDLIDSFSGLAALAYSCALRAGDAYRARKESTNPQELFEQWLEKVADIRLIDDEEEDPEDPPAAGADDDAGENPTPSPDE